MKDYYYFLGINAEASQDEIKKAYRKLSLKYHPDKNENDDFFVNRFREILEAYEILTDETKKKIYDKNFINQNFRKSILPPKIINFTASKIRVKKGEEITIYWQTQDADLVKIIPFGLEKLYGEKKIAVENFDNEGRFQILLHATNTLLQKTLVKGLIITQLSEEIYEISEIQKMSSKPKQKKVNKRNIIIFLATLFVVLILLFWCLFS